MKHAAEECLRASGVPWTIVRPTAFLETWIALFEQTAHGSGRPLVFGRGDNPINFVSVVDVAALVERAVLDTATRYQTIEIGGPQNLSLNQLAAAVQHAAGRPAGPRHVPRTILRLMAVALGPFKSDLARQAQAALTLDTADLVFDGSALRDALPDAAQIPFTSATEVLARGRGGVSDRRRTVRAR
jgi:NADH dehydrogenase